MDGRGDVDRGRSGGAGYGQCGVGSTATTADWVGGEGVRSQEYANGADRKAPDEQNHPEPRDKMRIVATNTDEPAGNRQKPVSAFAKAGICQIRR